MKNVPNMLCWFRIIIVPFILLFLLESSFMTGHMVIEIRIIISLILFIIGMISDALDGFIARKYNVVSNFGKMFDPIADKLLVLSIMTAFIENKYITALPIIIILAREFLITGLRLGAMDKGTVVAANIWGKLKTVFQTTAIIIIFLTVLFNFDLIIADIAIWVVAIFTIVSAIPYFKAYSKFIFEN